MTAETQLILSRIIIYIAVFYAAKRGWLWLRKKNGKHHLGEMRQLSKDVRSHARYVRNMRADIMTPTDVKSLTKAEADLLTAEKGTDPEAINYAAVTLDKITKVIMPLNKKDHAFRENLEVLVIAFAVAMAFRAYFLQPFQIPTGSMQPTLNGIRILNVDSGEDANLSPDPRSAIQPNRNVHGYQPDIWDKPYLQPLKWILTGDVFITVRAPASGTFQWTKILPDGRRQARVGGKLLTMRTKHINTPVNLLQGATFSKGDIIAQYLYQSGDHLFVNKVKWNFAVPKRGEVIVFEIKRNSLSFTDNGLTSPFSDPNAHYIKRLVGLPGEEIGILPPNLIINNEALKSPPAIVSIQNQERSRDGNIHDGYRLASHSLGEMSITVPYPAGKLQIGENRYYACGDNQDSSLDSRYWGPVFGESLVGPAAFVYWPFTKHFGPITR